VIRRVFLAIDSPKAVLINDQVSDILAKVALRAFDAARPFDLFFCPFLTQAQVD